jgi:hypothetical protein
MHIHEKECWNGKWFFFSPETPWHGHYGDNFVGGETGEMTGKGFCAGRSLGPYRSSPHPKHAAWLVQMVHHPLHGDVITKLGYLLITQRS